MSHTVTGKVKITELGIMEETCERLGYKFERGCTDLRFKDGVATIRIPGWHHGVVVKADGSFVYDNYNGNWGEQKKLDRLIDEYGADVATMAAYDQGYFNINRTVEENGDIVLEIQVD